VKRFVNQRLRFGYIGRRCTPLLHAVLKGHVAVARWLVERGADKEATESHNGFTSLHIAALVGRITVVKMLVESGANKDALSNANLTPLSLWLQRLGMWL